MTDDESKETRTKKPEEICNDDIGREEKKTLGWTLDAAAREVAVMGGAVFVSTALLSKAKEAAGCAEVPDDLCEGRVYGMRPSSFLTNIVTIVGLICACFIPLVGSIIDHTDHRRHVRRASSLTFTALIYFKSSY